MLLAFPVLGFVCLSLVFPGSLHATSSKTMRVIEGSTPRVGLGTRWSEGKPNPASLDVSFSDTSAEASKRRRSVAAEDPGVSMTQLMDMVRTLSENVQLLSNDFKEHRKMTQDGFKKVDAVQETLNERFSVLEKSLLATMEKIGEHMERGRKQFANKSEEISNSIKGSIDRLQRIEDSIPEKTEDLKRHIDAVSNAAKVVTLNAMHETESSIASLSDAMEAKRNATSALEVQVEEIKRDANKIINVFEENLRLINNSSLSAGKTLQNIEEAIPKAFVELRKNIAGDLSAFAHSTKEVILNGTHKVQSSIAELKVARNAEMQIFNASLTRLDGNFAKMLIFEARNATGRMNYTNGAWEYKSRSQPFTFDGCGASVELTLTKYDNSHITVSVTVNMSSALYLYINTPCMKRLLGSRLIVTVFYPYGSKWNVQRTLGSEDLSMCLRNDLLWRADSLSSSELFKAVFFNLSTVYLRDDTMAFGMMFRPGPLAEFPSFGTDSVPATVLEV